MKKISLIIMDLDNTLYDWYAAFIPSFYAMIDRAAAVISCDREKLLTQIRDIHLLWNDIEHPYSLIETDIVKEYISKIGEANAMDQLDAAFYAFNKSRKENLKLFPGVARTLAFLREQEISIVAFTESRYYGAVGRIERLQIGDFFSKIYCREQNISSKPKIYPSRPSQTPREKIISLPASAVKPNPSILTRIISDFNVDIDSVAYVGDSISKDIFMAKQVGCYAIWAKYGVYKDPILYKNLIRISHWTEEDIEREKYYALLSKEIMPDFVCENSILEISNILRGVGKKNDSFQ